MASSYVAVAGLGFLLVNTFTSRRVFKKASPNGKVRYLFRRGEILGNDYI